VAVKDYVVDDMAEHVDVAGYADVAGTADVADDTDALIW
jgi:hypothetical protein